jgi:hypothetical protein
VSAFVLFVDPRVAISLADAFLTNLDTRQENHLSINPIGDIPF